MWLCDGWVGGCILPLQPLHTHTTNTQKHKNTQALRDVPTGVYLGWASVGGGEGAPRCKAVVNVGYSPTFVGQVS